MIEMIDFIEDQCHLDPLGFVPTVDARRPIGRRAIALQLFRAADGAAGRVRPHRPLRLVRWCFPMFRLRSLSFTLQFCFVFR